MNGDFDGQVLRCRVLRALDTLAGFVGASAPDHERNDSVAAWVDTVAAQAEDAVACDERTLADAVASIDGRFKVSWTMGPADLLAHARRELIEIEQAMADADKRPKSSALRSDVVAECGDAMLLLARIAMCYGAESGLVPMRMTVAKTVRRLAHFERLVKCGITTADAWRQAKMMAKERT